MPHRSAGLFHWHSGRLHRQVQRARLRQFRRGSPPCERSRRASDRYVAGAGSAATLLPSARRAVDSAPAHLLLAVSPLALAQAPKTRVAPRVRPLPCRRWRLRPARRPPASRTRGAPEGERVWLSCRETKATGMVPVRCWAAAIFGGFAAVGPLGVQGFSDRPCKASASAFVAPAEWYRRAGIASGTRGRRLLLRSNPDSAGAAATKAIGRGGPGDWSALCRQFDSAPAHLLLTGNPPTPAVAGPLESCRSSDWRADGSTTTPVRHLGCWFLPAAEHQLRRRLVQQSRQATAKVEPIS